MYARISDEGFDRAEYGSHPHLYKSVFMQKYAYKLSVIVNCVYYEPKYPKLLTTQDMQNLSGKLLGICDVSCDLCGAIEICRKFTTPENPFFLYNFVNDRIYKLSYEHIENTILYHSMDFLPSELPRDASQHFSDKLFDYVIEIANEENFESFENLTISPEIKYAMMTFGGKLTGGYEYINELRRKHDQQIIDENLDSANDKIEKIVTECPELVSDLQNALFYQELSDESKEAIIRIANMLENRS